MNDAHRDEVPAGLVSLDDVGRGRPYILRDGEGEHILAHGGLRSLIAREDDTRGDLGLFINSGGPSRATVPHYHQRTTEFIFVLDGTTRVWLDDTEGNRVVDDLHPGDFALLPVGWVHAWAFTGDHNRFLAGNAPGGFEKIMRMFDPNKQTSLDDLRATEQVVDVIWTPEQDLFGASDQSFNPMPANIEGERR